MASHLLLCFILFCVAHKCYAGVLFSSLPPTLVVTASAQPGQVLRGGEDSITVTWGLSMQAAGADDTYRNVKLTLCYAPVSQADRTWRKTVDDLSKDKTCQFTIAKLPYDGSAGNETYQWGISKEVPTATYFVRAYAYNSAGEEVAFGQTTDAKKSSNLFSIQASSGRHVSLEIASACFSAFSLVSLFGFFLVEKKRNKRSSSK